MSDMVHYRGVLYEIHPQSGETLQDTAKKIFHKRWDYPHSTNKGDWIKTLCAYSEDYITFKYKLFKICKHEITPDDDIISAAFNEEGSIDFEVKYYNGGSSMQEAIESALKQLNFNS